MWVAVVNNGGFALYAPNKSVPLPEVGALGANWNLDVSAQLVPIPGIYETSNTVTAVNAAAGSWTRTQRSLGRYADRTETLFANNPRSGYAHRPAGTVTASDGTVVQISEFTSLRMHGMGFGPLLLPSPKLFEFFVAKP